MRDEKEKNALFIVFVVHSVEALCTSCLNYKTFQVQLDKICFTEIIFVKIGIYLMLNG